MITSPIAAERAALGCVLAGSSDTAELFDLLAPADFDEPHHENIWRAAQALHDAGKAPDPIQVATRLGNDAQSLPDTPALYLHDLMQAAPNLGQGPAYAHQVKAASRRRRVLAAATKAVQLATEVEDVDQLVERVRFEIDEATQAVQACDMVRVADVVPDVFDIAEQGHVAALPTGWSDLDFHIRGLQPGRLIVVAARPGVGKSVMGSNLALKVARDHDHAVLFCSMEMPRTEVVQRLVASQAGVDIGRMDSGATTEVEWTRLQRHHDTIMGLPISIEDNGQQSISSIRSAASKIRRTRDDLALIVVDYLQLMQTRDARNANRAELLGEISRGLKVIARDFNACVVAMAQVNRQATMRADSKPTMSDIRESGSIEADADIIVLLHRPEENGSAVDAIVAKNRSGTTGTAPLELVGSLAQLNSRRWTSTAHAS